MTCKITLNWADGRYTFALGLVQLEELQEKCNCGPLVLYTRIREGHWSVPDLRETIRLGLIGGGCEPSKAMNLIRRYVDERPLHEAATPAQLIVSAALFGGDEDPLPDQDVVARDAMPVEG